MGAGWLEIALVAAMTLGCSSATELGNGEGGAAPDQDGGAGLSGTGGQGGERGEGGTASGAGASDGGTAGTAGAAGTASTAGAAGAAGTAGAAGAAAAAGSDAQIAVICGSIICPAGEFCCNESCEICTSPGEACVELKCTEPPDRDPCDAAKCGPAPGMPSRICPDGSVAGPVCVWLDDDTCGWQIVDCPPSVGRQCGAIVSYPCGLDEYCDAPDCGWGIETGYCQPRPEVCTRELKPVCGCDGNDYSNPCLAHAAATEVDYEGECGAWTCTFGMDQTCNDDPVISSLHGVCQQDGTCKCNEGFEINPATGRCL